MANTNGAAGGDLFASVRTYTQQEVEAMLHQMAQRALQPAFEEGPHLEIPEIRDLKREQMIEAGYTVETPNLTDDMRAILAEGA